VPVDHLSSAVSVAAGDHLLFLFGDPSALAATLGTGASWPDDDLVYELIERGQADGTFDAGVSARWIQHTLWALVYRGCEDADLGELPLHGGAQGHPDPGKRHPHARLTGQARQV
jgi:hypothetical protein